MKKVLTVVILICYFFSTILTAVADDGYMSYSTTTSHVASTISISGGKVVASTGPRVFGSIVVKYTAYLQKANGSAWSLVKSIQSSTTSQMSVTAEKGYTYRTKVVWESYDGSNNLIASGTYYSNEVTY